MRWKSVIRRYWKSTVPVSGKVDTLLGDSQMDESRLAAEVILYADKICTDEETVRLRSHIKATKDALEAGGSIGRKLDFIAAGDETAKRIRFFPRQMIWKSLIPGST